MAARATMCVNLFETPQGARLESASKRFCSKDSIRAIPFPRLRNSGKIVAGNYFGAPNSIRRTMSEVTPNVVVRPQTHDDIDDRAENLMINATMEIALREPDSPTLVSICLPA